MFIPLENSVPRSVPVPRSEKQRGSIEIVQIDLDDKVFFDHILDHVPGMLIAAAVLELAERSPGAIDHDTVIYRLDFNAMCELGEETTIRVKAPEPSTWSASVDQRGRATAEARIAPAAPLDYATVFFPPAIDDKPMDQALAHRHRPENVYVSKILLQDGVAWGKMRRAVAANAFANITPRARALITLVEVVRQFGIGLLHMYADVPIGHFILLRGFTATAPTTLPSEVDLWVRVTLTPPEQLRRKVRFDLLGGTDELRVIGSVSFGQAVLDKEEYRAFRSRAVTKNSTVPGAGS